MNWIRRLLDRDGDRQRRNVELARLTVRSQQTVAHARRTEIESARVASAIRNTVKALRAEAHRR